MNTERGQSDKIVLIPGKGYKASDNNGWVNIPLTEILKIMNIENEGSFGNWGDKFNHKDKYAPHYSIPNPWASALLFEKIIFDQSDKQYKKQVIRLLMNLLYELTVKETLQIVKVPKPNDINDPFYKFWEMSPESIRYGENGDIYLIETVENKREERIIVGGCSKTTLVWALQTYKSYEKLEDLQKNPEFNIVLRTIKDFLRFPLEERIITDYGVSSWFGFWNTSDGNEECYFKDVHKYDYLRENERDLISSVPSDISDLSWVIQKITPQKIFEKWFAQYLPATNSKGFLAEWVDTHIEDVWFRFETYNFMRDDNKKYINTFFKDFLYPIKEDSSLLKEENISKETGIINFYDSLNKKLATLTESYQRLFFKKMPNNDSDKDTFNKEFTNILINAVIPDDYIAVEDHITLETEIISNDFRDYLYRYIKEVKKISINENFVDARSFLIYPPFPSNEARVCVVEFHSTRNLNEFDKFIFYDKDGVKYEEVQNTESVNVLEQQVNEDIVKNGYFRLYKFDDRNEFPTFIKFTKTNQVMTNQGQSDRNYYGFMKINNKPAVNQNNRVNELIVGLDFGSSNSTITYNIPNLEERGIMNFQSSRPIVITQKGASEQQLLFATITDRLYAEPPTDGQKDETPNWMPIRSIWKEYQSQYSEWDIKETPNNESKFLEAGNIPMYYGPFLLTGVKNYIKSNIKWDDDENLIKSFLSHLFTMICVEAEIKNCNYIKIRWSYPGAFTFAMKNSISNVYQELSGDFNEYHTGDNIKIDTSEGLADQNIGDHNVVRPGYSEAYCAYQYFVHVQKIPLKGKLQCTIDIGGGTTDISFVGQVEGRGRILLWEDSIKFAGANLIKSIPTLHKDLVEMVLPKGQFNKKKKNEYKKYDFDSLLRFSPIKDKGWNGKLTTYISNNASSRFYEKLALFYASICYFVGLHVNNYDLEKYNFTPNDIQQFIFCGNGYLFMDYITKGKRITENNAYQFFNLTRELFYCGLYYKEENGEEEEQEKNKQPEYNVGNIGLVFSEKPKKEVALGLLYAHIIANKNDTIKKELIHMSGLNIKKGQEKIGWNSWFEEGMTYGGIQYDQVDFAIFRNFLINFYKSIHKYQFRELTKVIDKNNVEEYIDNIMSTEFEGEFSRIIQENINKELTTPLFFIAIDTWINLIAREEETNDI